jgi:transposase-like protein
VARHGRDDTQPNRQRYRCKDCEARFDDLTDTIFAGHHWPLRTWVLCLYLMGLNLSNRQIAQEPDLSVSDVQVMTEQLRFGLVARIAPVRFWTAKCVGAGMPRLPARMTLDRRQAPP